MSVYYEFGVEDFGSFKKGPTNRMVSAERDGRTETSRNENTNRADQQVYGFKVLPTAAHYECANGNKTGTSQTRVGATGVVRRSSRSTVMFSLGAVTSLWTNVFSLVRNEVVCFLRLRPRPKTLRSLCVGP